MSREEYMRKAIVQARLAQQLDEVPVGAVIVMGDEIIAEAHNLKESKKCGILHAEILAIMSACEQLGTKYLQNCTLYVTLEPCYMCAGAIVNARLGGVVFGAYDLKSGSCGTIHNLPQDISVNHRCSVQGGVLEQECGGLLTSYFRGKRNDREYKRQGDTTEGFDR